MLKMKKMINLILIAVIFHTIFSFEITPYATYQYNSDSNLYSNEGDLVVDMFGGSGTTGIAVAENGDVYIVSDIEDGIVKITLQ